LLLKIQSMFKDKTVRGYDIVARALAAQGVEFVFGIVGVPVIELGTACMESNMNYYGFRNEQTAGYAAGITGYLTGRPGVCLAVGGPGMTNTISGMAEAMVNKRPMIVIAGASDAVLEGRGAF
jgi:2-hydroxyacyl-CoA lyase 1